MAHQKTMGKAAMRDGHTLNYCIHGSSQAPQRLALVHSLGMNHTVWDGVAELLADRVQVLAYDCRGHGDSTKSPAPYQLETFGNDLADLMTHAGWHKAHIAGGSLGGSVVLQFAALYPERAQTLGLIDTTSWYGPEREKNWNDRAVTAETRGLPAMIEMQTSRWFSDKFRAERADAVSKCAQIFLANQVECFAATCRMLGSFDLRNTLGAIQVPTAVIVGEEDYATPVEMSKVLEAGIPGATLQIISMARHLTFVERPEIIAEALTKLMQRAVA